MAWDLGSGSYHHASEAGGSGSRLRPRQRDLLNIGRQRDANRLKELTGDAGGGGAQQEALAILLELDLLQPVEIAPDVAPFSGNPLAAEAIFEFFGEQQRQKRAEHMAADRHVAAVVGRAGGEHGLGLAQQLLDPQQVAVAPHDLQWGDLSVGTQYVEPVEARVVGDPCLVDGEVPGRDGLEITAEAAVADQRLVPTSALSPWASLVRSPSRIAARCSASRRASARLRQTMYRRPPIFTCLASSSVRSPDARGTTSGTNGV